MKLYYRIPLIYLIISLLWIALSDRALIWLNLEQELSNSIQSYKGYFFVVLSSWLMYALIKKYHLQQERVKNDFQRLFEQNPNPMWIYDIHTFNILLANQAASTNYGYSELEFKGLSLFDLRPTSEHQALKNQLKHSNLRVPISDSGIWLHKKKNGTCFYVHIYSHASVFNEIECRIVSAIDVDDMHRHQVAREELTQRLKKYAYITSHDIRGPISRMLALADFYDNFKETKTDFVIQNIRKTSIELDGIIRRMNEQVDDELGIDLDNMN